MIRRQLPPVSNLFWQQPVGGKRFLVKNASDLLPIMGTLVSHWSPLTLKTDANLNLNMAQREFFIRTKLFPVNVFQEIQEKKR